MIITHLRKKNGASLCPLHLFLLFPFQDDCDPYFIGKSLTVDILNISTCRVRKCVVTSSLILFQSENPLITSSNKGGRTSLQVVYFNLRQCLFTYNPPPQTKLGWFFISLPHEREGKKTKQQQKQHQKIKTKTRGAVVSTFSFSVL
jgi:hypothetical protein